MGAMMKKIPLTMMGRPLMRPLISQLVVVLVLCNILNGSVQYIEWIILFSSVDQLSIVEWINLFSITFYHIV
jgi:hypothetical protein